MTTKMWGRVSFNAQQKAWCVRGQWQGRALYYSGYQSELGWEKCSTPDRAYRLQAYISNEMANGRFNPDRYKKSKPLHLKNHALAWLDKVEKDIAKGTKYRSYVTNWIVPILGDVFLEDMNYGHYEKLWREIPRSRKHRKNIITCLYACMEDARRNGHISQCPEKIIFKGKYTIPQKDPEWVDVQTQERILAEIPDRHRPIFRFLALTGVRVSEARALRKKDIHNDYISIKVTFGADGKLKEVKQKKERRIPLHRSLRYILATCAQISEYVFINPDTGKVYSKNINRIFNKACKKVGTGIALNNFGRHSFGNQMVAAGAPIDDISKWLGHSDSSVTKRHYASPNTDSIVRILDGRVVRLKTGS